MNISNVEANNAVLLTSLSSKTKSEEVNSGATSAISDTFSESDETAKFKEIASKYDITNMSRNEANQMYKELYDNKLISLKDMLVTIDYSRLPGGKEGTLSVNGVKVNPDSDVKMNWLENLKTQAEYNKKYGNMDFQNLFDEKLGLAEKIKHFQTNV